MSLKKPTDPADMFPVAKLERLSLSTALKKTALILHGLEMDLVTGKDLSTDREVRRYLVSLGTFLTGRNPPPAVAEAVRRMHADPAFVSADAFRRALNSARHAILSFLGAEAAEWDFLDEESGALDAGARRVLPLRVYLEDIRSPYNVGSILRTAEAFGAERVWLSSATPPPTHRRAQRTARGAAASVCWAVAGLEVAEQAGPVFALETGGMPLREFRFPASGTVLVGSEELGLSPEALALADRGLGRVSIPLAGAKRSLNVAVAFGILMQWWRASLE